MQYFCSEIIFYNIIIFLEVKWYKKGSEFAKWALQNNSDAIEATHIK